MEVRERQKERKERDRKRVHQGNHSIISCVRYLLD
jgi:hypothetical protein